MGEFLSQCTEQGSELTVQALTLYKTYERWCQVNGIKPMTNTMFGKKITERGFAKRSTKHFAVYHGLAVMDENGLEHVYRGGE